MHQKHFLNRFLSLKITDIRALLKDPAPSKRRILIEYSSPNIAKPFHLGHFRATLTGNFVCNINRAVGHEVVGINYLGDWGTQFNLLNRALKTCPRSLDEAEDPMRFLHEIYVKANREEVGANHQSQQSEIDIGLWQRIRDITMKHLQSNYARMNIRFDAYEFESQYDALGQQMVDHLLSSGQAIIEPDGAVVVMQPNESSGVERRIVLRKSDQSTLYLTRDLAAALSRHKRYHFDQFYYVVELGQRDHFRQLQSLLSRLGYTFGQSSQSSEINVSRSNKNSLVAPFHLPFGRVEGASSRMGQGLFLVDILNNARDAMLDRMQASPNTRSDDSARQSESHHKTSDQIADVLGVTCLVIQMLRTSRLKPIRLRSFLGAPTTQSNESETVENASDLSGLGLQYCHARLCSLERRAIQSGLLSSNNHEGREILNLVDERLANNTLAHPAYISLLDQFDAFPAAIQSAYRSHQPSILVQYVNQLTSKINSFWHQLPVLSESQRSDQLLRLATLLAARNLLSICLQLLGIDPLSAI